MNIDNSICTICLVTMKNQQSSIKLSCNHKFCKICLESWIDSKYIRNSTPKIEQINICPMCRDSSTDFMCMRCHQLYETNVNNLCNCNISENVTNGILDKIIYTMFILLIIIFMTLLYSSIQNS